MKTPQAPPMQFPGMGPNLGPPVIDPEDQPVAAGQGQQPMVSAQGQPPMPPGGPWSGGPWNGPFGAGDPAPDRPQYTAAFNPATMTTSGLMNDRLDKIQLNRAPLDAYNRFAMNAGPSDYAKFGLSLNDLQTKRGINSAVQGAAGQAAAARSNLASRGGLDSGARERIARDEGRNVLSMSQDAQGRGDQGALQLSMHDADQKTQALSQLPGMELQSLQPDFQKSTLAQGANQFDVGNKIAEGQAKNLFDMNTYNQQMKAWASNKSAQATENSGKK